MEGELIRLLEELEWVQQNEKRIAQEQLAVLKMRSASAFESYRKGLSSLETGESGFSKSVTGLATAGRVLTQRAVLKVFNSVFKFAGPRKTAQLNLKDLTGGDFKQRIVTIGPFGFGTRRTSKSNSVRVDDWKGVTFILLNSGAIVTELRKINESKMADLLEQLVDVVPVTVMMDYPTFVRGVQEPRKVIVQKGVGLASSLVMMVTQTGVRWWVEVAYSGGVEKISLNGDGSQPFASSIIAFKQFEDVLELVVQDAEVRIGSDIGKVAGLKDKMQATFGNYLLGVSL